MPRQLRQQVKVLDAENSATNGTVVNVADSRHVVIGVSATLNTSLTFKFKGAVLGSDQTDLTTAQAVTNIWDYVSAYDLEDPSALIDGDTGVTIDNDTVVNNTRQYVVNTDHLQQFTVEITAYTDGQFTAWVAAAND